LQDLKGKKAYTLYLQSICAYLRYICAYLQKPGKYLSTKNEVKKVWRFIAVPLLPRLVFAVAGLPWLYMLRINKGKIIIAPIQPKT